MLSLSYRTCQRVMRNDLKRLAHLREVCALVAYLRAEIGACVLDTVGTTKARTEQETKCEFTRTTTRTLFSECPKNSGTTLT